MGQNTMEQELEKCIKGTYTLNEDGSIDVKGDVDLIRQNLNKIPFKFNKVNGNFWCSLNYLKSLKGSPKKVGKIFNCWDNKVQFTEKRCKKSM